MLQWAEMSQYRRVHYTYIIELRLRKRVLGDNKNHGVGKVWFHLRMLTSTVQAKKPVNTLNCIVSKTLHLYTTITSLIPNNWLFPVYARTVHKRFWCSWFFEFHSNTGLRWCNFFNRLKTVETNTWQYWIYLYQLYLHCNEKYAWIFCIFTNWHSPRVILPNTGKPSNTFKCKIAKTNERQNRN